MTTDLLRATTELDAVNMMLKAIRESAVASITEPSHEDAATAVTILRHWNKTVQEQGWRFNKRYNNLLERDGSNELVVPVNVLSITPGSKSAHAIFAFVDGKLYDLDNNTFAWTEDLYVDYVLHYAFEKIPQAARNYILQMAGLEFTGDEVPSTQRPVFSKERASMAHGMLRRTESLIRQPNMITGSLHAMPILASRRPFY